MVQQKLVSSEKTDEKEKNCQDEPKLRFPEFNEPWKRSKLEDICNIQDGTHSTPNYTDEGIPFFSVETITSNAEPKFISAEEHEKLIKRCQPKKGDILLTRIGTLAKSKIVDWDYDFSIYVSLALLNSIKIDSEFLNQYINTPNYQKDFLSKSLLLAVPQKINLKDLKETKITYPSLEEQKKLSLFLKNIDKKIELLEKKLVLYQKLELGLKDRIFKKYENNDFVKLNEFCSIKKGKQLNKSDMIENGKYYVLNGGKEPSGYTNHWNVDENTITISEGGNSCGYVSFNSKKFYCGGHCYYLTIKHENFHLYYLFHYLKHIEPEIMRLRVGSGLPNIQKGDIENIRIFRLKYGKQKEIGDFFELINKKVINILKEKEELSIFKKGLLQKMFV